MPKAGPGAPWRTSRPLVELSLAGRWSRNSSRRAERWRGRPVSDAQMAQYFLQNSLFWRRVRGHPRSSLSQYPNLSALLLGTFVSSPRLSGTQLTRPHRHGVVTIQLTPEEANLYSEVPVVYNQTTGFYVFPVCGCGNLWTRNCADRCRVPSRM